MKEVKTVLFIVWIIFSASDEIKDEDSGPKISSVSGANRKRKWKEDDEEEEQKEEAESSDVDTSSDDEVEDDEVNKTTEVGEAKETTLPPKTEDKQTEEQQKTSEQDGQTQRKISEQNKKLSQPAIFIPVDRSPEIQVGANCMCLRKKRQSFS